MRRLIVRISRDGRDDQGVSAIDASVRRRAALRRRRSARWLRPVLRVSLAVAVLGGSMGGGMWAWRSGLFDRTVESIDRETVALSTAAGLAVDEIYLEGRRQTDGADVLAALAVERGTPMVGLDLDAMCERLEALAWVAAAEVERRWPDTLYVRLQERKAVALWQRGDGHVLIDEDGAVIEGEPVDRFVSLPVIVGDDAPAHLHELLALVASEEALAGRMAAAVRVGGRRWDIHFDNGVIAKLPATDPARAWRRLAVAEREHELLERDLVALDLRIPGEFTVRLAPTGVGRKAKEGVGA